MKQALRLALLPLLAAAGALLAGCPAMVPFMDPPTHKVVAVYPHLPGHRLAVVVHTEESTEVEYPYLAENLTRFVTNELKKKVSNLSFVPEAEVSNYKSGNYLWSDVPPAQIGHKLGAEMVLFINVDFYSPSQPGEMNFMQGRLTCNCKLVSVAAEEAGADEWANPDLTVLYPPKDYSGGDMSMTSGKTQTELLRAFSEKLAWNFCDHEEKD